MAAQPLKKGDQGIAVRRLQEQLLLLGYALPRFGADGALGDETLFAVELFKRDSALGGGDGGIPSTIPRRVVEALQAAVDAKSRVPLPPGYQNAIEGHKHEARSTRTPFRTWKQVVGVTLHQTAGLYGEGIAAWQTVHAHLGITRKGQIIQMYDFTEVVNHGHGLNATDVGIEIDGWYEGIEGKFATLWQPAKGPKRQAMQPTAEQIAAAQAAVRWIRDAVEANGGALKFVHAHRQGSNQRQSDPGSRIWRDVGIWAQDKLQLRDGGMVNGRYVDGETYTTGTGLRLPGAWDSRYARNAY